VRRFHERRVAWTEDLARAGKYRCRILNPRLWLQRIAARPAQLPEAIIIAPTAAGRIDDEQLFAIPERLRAFIHVRITTLFPVQFRPRYAHALTRNRERIAHCRDVNILSDVLRPFPTRPDKIKRPFDLNDRA